MPPQHMEIKIRQPWWTQTSIRNYTKAAVGAGAWTGMCVHVCVCQRFSHSSCLATICPQYWHQWACRRPLTNKLKQAAVGWKKKALWGHQLMSSPLSLLTQCKSGQRQLEMPADAQRKYLLDLVTVLGRKKNPIETAAWLKKEKRKKERGRIVSKLSVNSSWTFWWTFVSMTVLWLRKQQQQQWQHIKERKGREAGSSLSTKSAGWKSSTCKQSPSTQEAVLSINNTHVLGGSGLFFGLFLSGACTFSSFPPGIPASSSLQLTGGSMCECGSDDKWILEFGPVFFASDFIPAESLWENVMDFLR